MIYSIKNDFIFLHCPRTSGTAISKSLLALVPDAQYDDIGKHVVYSDLPNALKTLRAFTVLRSFRDVRESYFRHVRAWYEKDAISVLATRWFVEHAQRLSAMSLEEYLASDEPPVSVDGYAEGCREVFQYEAKPYNQIASFCGVDPGQFGLLMEAFRMR
jgi:hypothetical protein